MNDEDLPETWELKRLSEISELEAGKRSKGSVGDYPSEVPSIGGGELDSTGGFDINESSPRIPEKFYENEMNTGKVRSEDILIVKDGATTGKVSYVGDDFPYDKAAVNPRLHIT